MARPAPVVVGIVVVGLLGCGGRAVPSASGGGPSCPGPGIGALQGVIYDGSGHGMNGVVVLARATASAGAGSATTDRRGVYKLCLPPGDYEVQLVTSHELAVADAQRVRVRENVTTPLYQRIGPTPAWHVPNCSDVASGNAPVGCFP